MDGRQLSKSHGLGAKCSERPAASQAFAVGISLQAMPRSIKQDRNWQADGVSNSSTLRIKTSCLQWDRQK